MKPSRNLAIALAVGILMTGAGVVHAETLQDAVAFMLKSNPDVRAQYYNRMAKEKEVRQAKAGYLPTIDVYVAAGLDRQHESSVPPQGFATSWPASSTVSVRQNVFRFFGTQSEVERQEARVKSQEYLLHGSAENNALLSSKAFLNVLRNQELYDLAQENLTNHLRIHDQVKLRSESGVDRRADFDQVMGRLALAQSNLVAAQANLADSATDYQAVVGHAPGNLIKPEPAGSALPKSIEEAEQLAVLNNPTLKSAKADIEARNAQHATAKSQLYPSLDLALDYKWRKDTENIPGRREDFLAMATVSFNILNGGWNKARLGQTTYEIYEAQEIAENTKRQTIQSIRLSWEANKTATERVAFLEEYVRAAGQTSDAFGAQWNIGRRTMFDLLDTQAEYINAKASLVNAKYDKIYSEYRILNAMSQLIPFLGLQLSDQNLVVTTKNAP
ncbi:MAG: TolC family outer membrane protein [Desulfuromonadaceae bacterium]|nr:TolC family outer membrane protein [Desulfuromonadaceae bacterium]